MIEIGKKFFYRGLKAKKAKIRLGMWGILHFNYQVKKETISGEAARIQYVHLKANYSFSHKFSFSKIWPSLRVTKPPGRKLFFEKRIIMPQAGFEPTTSWLLERSLMPYPCSHFYFDTKFGDRLYSKEKRRVWPVLF